MKKSILVVAALIQLLAASAAAQVTPRVNDGEPCCAITAIDVAKGIVTARDNTTGHTFQFEVDSRSLLGSLRVGGQVWLNAGRDKVSLDRGEPCCPVVGGVVVDVQPDAGEPCCGVVAVDVARGLVTARDVNTGRTFQFSVSNAAAFKPGDRIKADLAARRVSAAGGVVEISAAFEPFNGEPCCAVVSIEPDAAEPCCNLVTIKNNAAGQLARFSAPKEITRTLRAGAPIWAEAAAGYAIVRADGGRGRAVAFSYPLQTRGGSAWSAAASAATSAQEAQAWVMTPNPDLRGATGRIVVNVPGEEGSMIFHILKSGEAERIDTWYGSKTGSFMPGTYDVQMWEARITGVPVKRGMDTRIRAGVLNVTFDGSYKILNERGDAVFNASGSEKRKVVLPAGRYRIELPSGQQEILIKDGEVTDF